MKSTESKLLPAVVEAAVKPKPTKREVIEAMAKLQIENIKAENLLRAEKRKRLDEEIENGLRSLLHKRGLAMFKVRADSNRWSSKWSASLTINFSQEDLTESLIAKMKQRNEAEDLREPYFNDVVKQIARKMAGFQPHDVRVEALLEDQESRKALGLMLAALNK
jgi:hypothetical protein